MRVSALLGAIVAGLLIGVALDLLAVALARWGPVGTGWSLRGNGALIVPFGLGPAALAGGWAALVRHSRGAAPWRAWGVGTALSGAALSGVGLLLLILGGSIGQSLAAIAGVAPLLLPIVAPLVAAIAPVRGPVGARRPLVDLVAGALYTVGLLGGFIAVARLVAPV